MKIILVPNLHLGTRTVGPTDDAAANLALFQRYSNRLQARLGIGFQVYVDQSAGYDLLKAPADDDTAKTCWVVAAAVYQALTTEIIARHHLLTVSDQAVILKMTDSIEQQLKPPTATT
ncbi:hypothetical protein C5Z25_00720 [Lactobacillus sp. CBA3605]|uniref:hypothetical protein n=1 Tax=Lactobacillus sp. CBA3605 TaxID=2099788 RepID=UPI000CFB1A17|nr:hypothetical protein [Lactobacillus sp. CBA3605]AVK60388.1 hypothetical protein C5Z25_00720 [Lactobacillus sp. CBA3605]